jgi:outer membrane protein TolC
MKNIKTSGFIFFIYLIINAENCFAQVALKESAFNVNDSLSLPGILQKVLENYPSVIKAQEAINVAEAGIGLAESSYYPVINGDAGYTRLGPTSEISMPFGTFQLFPANNYNANIHINQIIYDFGKTSRNVKLEKSSKELSEQNVELVKQRLTLLASVSYYSLIYLQEAIKIKETQIATLEKHLDFVTRKMETGSATEYEILSTKVRLSNAENQKVDLETSRQTQMAIINSFLGLPVNTELKVNSSFIIGKPGENSDSMIQFALEHRNEMVLAKLRKKHAELHFRTIKVQNNPSLNAFATGSVKNGYFPDLNAPTPNYAAGIGINFMIFDATRHRNNLRIANSEINMSGQDIDQVTRDISTEVFQNETSLQASQKKIEQSDLQVKQAEDALDLAATSFKSGVITNLDLLDAETALEESRVNLLRARIDYAINLVRLNISLGKPII